MPNRERLIELGWKQGALLLPNDGRLKKNAHYNIPDDTRLLIVSQTCDLVQGSFEKEPYFEVLCIHPLGREPKGDYGFEKNSRRIEFSVDIDGVAYWYSHPYERHTVKRDVLLDLTPAAFLEDEKTLETIVRWLARRYTRTAFPEKFVKRIDARKKQIGKKFADLNSFVSNVFVKLSTYKELSDGQLYDLEIILLMKAKTFDDKNQYKRCGELKDQLEHQLNQCKGINVADINIESTAALIIDGLNGFREWDYSYLSFREPDNSAKPVDI